MIIQNRSYIKGETLSMQLSNEFRSFSHASRKQRFKTSIFIFRAVGTIHECIKCAFTHTKRMRRNQIILGHPDEDIPFLLLLLFSDYK